MVRFVHQAGAHGCLQAKEVIMDCASSSSPELQFGVESLEGAHGFNQDKGDHLYLTVLALCMVSFLYHSPRLETRNSLLQCGFWIGFDTGSLKLMVWNVVDKEVDLS